MIILKYKIIITVTIFLVDVDNLSNHVNVMFSSLTYIFHCDCYSKPNKLKFKKFNVINLYITKKNSIQRGWGTGNNQLVILRYYGNSNLANQFRAGHSWTIYILICSCVVLFHSVWCWRREKHWHVCIIYRVWFRTSSCNFV